MESAQQYAKCLEKSSRISWQIDRDVLRGRKFDFAKKFLPDGLSKVAELDFLSKDEKRTLSQIQGRTYANMFGLVERFINAKVLEVSRDHWLGNQVALEALVRFSSEELKHQELFRRIEGMIAEGMPDGYRFVPQPNEVAAVVLAKSTWAVLALTCHIELFTLAHYRQSIQTDDELSELYADVFLYHWKEESQHAILDELEWMREDAKLFDDERDRAVADLIDLVRAVDLMLRAQAMADSEYFALLCGHRFSAMQLDNIGAVLLKAYRWQYLVSGFEQPRFQQNLSVLTNESQRARINEALAEIVM
jgi:hypothetical protein